MPIQKSEKKLDELRSFAGMGNKIWLYFLCSKQESSAFGWHLPCPPTNRTSRSCHHIFLPPNTTSVLQSIDQGVIRSLKASNEEEFPKISILQSMKVLLSSANTVWEATIITCFKKANINSPNQEVAETGADDLSKCLV